MGIKIESGGTEVVRMDILDRIRQLRDERGWSNYRLSQETGIAQTTLRNMFKRNTAPTFTTLESICKGFGITLSQFFADDSEAVTLDTGQRKMFELWNTLDEEQKNALFELLKKK